MIKKIFFLVVFPVALFAQDFGIKFSGFVKNDFFFDTRQNVNIREGHFLLYPMGKNLDAAGNDINDVANFNFLSIQTRLTGNISAPDALGAKVSGVIEADFFGNENANFVDANGFRLRHAIVKLNWENTELLAGQYWHPLFITSCFSGVISFNTGAPIQPFSRNPQLRITHKIGNVSIMGALLAQRDFTSPGGSTLLRNASLPEVQGQIQISRKNEEAKSELLFGVGGGLKSLKPLLNTEKSGKKYITEETVSSFSATAFFKYQAPTFTYKLQGVYGQDLYDLIMLGGYAVSGVIDTAKNTVQYTSLKTLSVWSELITKAGDNWELAVWGGYTKNLGAEDQILFYSNQVDGNAATIRGADINSIIRISPRVVYTEGRTSFALETEYTSAAYALKDSTGKLLRDEYGKITSSENISNLRVLFSVVLKF